MSRYYRAPTDCTKSGGFIDTQGCTPTGGPASGTSKSGDCLRNPNSSVGYWLETTNSASGVARIDSVTTMYTFSNPIVLDSCPNGTYNQDPTATWRWTGCTTLNGWTYSLSADGKTLTLKYTKPTIVTTSTATNGTGDYLPGYFINYHTADPCVATSTTISTSHTMTYSTKTNPTGTTFTKNIGARSIV